MNLKTFSVASTNLFPATNTTNGGQLLTEFNLRAKDAVLGFEKVQYVWGPTFTHSDKDFEVSANISDSAYFPNTASTTGSILTISPGRAILNGYYVENLEDMTIDLAAINADLATIGESLSGECCIGLRVMFSGETTMLGSILGEDANGYYEGVQVVILPKSTPNGRGAFHTPLDSFYIPGTSFPINCWEEGYRDFVTADLLLATFTYVNGAITNLLPNTKKSQGIPASRIMNIDDVISDDYVKKSGLNPKKLYTFAGKGTNPDTGNSTWCDSTDSLMIWDSNPTFGPVAPTENEAVFQRSYTNPDQVQLVIPHKQVDGMVDGQGNAQYYKSKVINLPQAEYGSGASGLVTKAYTDTVKQTNYRINEFYQLTNGKQVAFIPELNPNGTEDGTTYKKLPNINDAWHSGDYVLVAKDWTAVSDLTDTTNTAPPSTIYVIRPAAVTSLGNMTDTQPEGMCLGIAECPMVDDEPETGYATKDYWGIGSGNYHGSVLVDYFQLNITYSSGTVVKKYRPVYTTDGIKTYSDVIMLTGQIPFASTTLTGGFLNAPDDYIDAGYVYLDEYGHLRLRDYALLRSGLLAYQLGQDQTIEAGLTVSEIQSQLNEYVNQRIAFPDITQTINSLVGTASTSVINVTMTLPDDLDGETSLTVSGIDSRFNTAVCLNIYGTATSNTTINITDCAKVMIKLYDNCTPKIVVKRSCLYYDYQLFDALYSAEDITIWYTKFKSDDKNLVVDGMTVRAVELQSMYNDPESNYNVVSPEYWSLTAQNDNHFDIALQSITFDGTATIVGCSVLVKNNSSSNVLAGRYLFKDNAFYLPQGPNLYYPSNCLRQAVNVTGRFISAYVNTGGASYIMQETDFSLKTQTISSRGVVTNGEVAFLVNAYEFPYANATNIDVFDPNKFHSFSGTTLL